MRSVRARRAGRSRSSAAASCVRPSMTPIEGSSGVEATLARVARPLRSTATRSVKVPPTSMPIRYISAASISGAVAAPPPNEAALDIARPRLRASPSWIAPAAASAGLDHKDVAGVDLDPDLLGGQGARPLSGRVEDIAMRRAIRAPQNAAGAVADPVAGG